MYDLHLTEEQSGFRDAVREFVRAEVKPAALDARRLDAFEKPLLMDLLRQASQMGLRTLTLSEESGGAGADNLTACIVMEELAAGDLDLAATLGETALVARVLFDELMTSEQRARFLPAFIDSDDNHLAYAGRDPEIRYASGYHRPAATPDAAPPIAVKQSDGDWVVNGDVPHVANAPIARLIAIQVSAKDRSGATAPATLLVSADASGLSVRASADAAAAKSADRKRVSVWHHGVAGQVVLKECRVPAHCLLGGEDPTSAIDAYWKRASVQTAAITLGMSQAAFDAAVEYAHLRRQGGRHIIEHEAIGTLLADMSIKLEAARTLVWKAAWALDHPDAVHDRSISALPLHRMVHVFCAEMMREVTESAAECFGAMGVMRDMPLQHYVHQANVSLHANLSAGAGRLLIAEAVAGYERPRKA